MKIYVASSWRNVHFPGVVESIKAAGHEVYDFRSPDPSDPTNMGFRWQETDPGYNPARSSRVTVETWNRMLAHPAARRGYTLDRAALSWCDLCVYVLPCGRSASFELGFCIGAGKQAIVLALEPVEPDLMFSECHIVGSLAEMHSVLGLFSAER